MHILLPTFLFPPFCSPGSMRLGRFVERFVERGAQVTVVTAAREDYEHGFPRQNNLDDALVENLPSEVRVVRTTSVRPGRGVYVLKRLWLGRLYRFTCTPDCTRRWHKTALQRCLSVHRSSRVDCVYTSSNPLSAHLIGAELKKRLDVPWVAEFRDPWTTSPFKTWETKLHYWLERRQQSNILRSADHVIANTSVAKRQMMDSFKAVSGDDVSVVPNSFEPSIEKEDSEGDAIDYELNVRDDEMLIAHVGTMRGVMPRSEQNYSLKKRLFEWVSWGGRYSITDVDKLGNSPWYFAKALKCVFDDNPEWNSNIRLVVAGRLGGSSREFEVLKDRLELPTQSIQYIGVRPHSEAVHLMKRADALLVNCAYPTDMRPIPVVPAKTYEYLGVGKPILAFLPPGDARNIIEQSGLGYLAPPNDVEKIAQTIAQLYRQFTKGELPGKGQRQKEVIRKFRSDRLADLVFGIFENEINMERGERKC